MDQTSDPLLIPFKAITKYGYKDDKEAIVIPAKFDEAFHFYNSLAVVRLGCSWGYIDVKGNVTLTWKDLEVDEIEHIPTKLFSIEVAFDRYRGYPLYKTYIHKGEAVVDGEDGKLEGVILRHWEGKYVKLYLNNGDTVLVNYLEQKVDYYHTLESGKEEEIAISEFNPTDPNSHYSILRLFECLLQAAELQNIGFSLTDAMPVLLQLQELPHDRFDHAVNNNKNHSYALPIPALISQSDHVVKITIVGCAKFSNWSYYKIRYELESATFPGLAKVDINSESKDNAYKFAANFSVNSPGKKYQDIRNKALELWQNPNKK